jgi:HK97 family phage portal protein
MKFKLSNIFKRSAPPGGSVGLNYTHGYSNQQAMLLSAVYRCVNIISDSIAALPIKTYKIEGKKRYFREFIEHPVYSLLYRFPNENLTRFTLMKCMASDMLLFGNAFAYIKRDGNQKPVAIHYLPAGDVTFQYDLNNPIDRNVEYIVNGFIENIHDEDMIHIVNYSMNGIEGISTLRYATMSIGLSMVAENHAHNYFASGANMSGISSVDSSLTDKQKQDILDG